MAVTIGTPQQQGVDSYGRRFVEADCTFANPYTVGGEPVTLASIGLSRVERVEVTYAKMPDNGATTTATHGRQIVPVLTNVYAPLLKLFVSNNTESGAIDQTQVVQRIRFVGR